MSHGVSGVSGGTKWSQRRLRESQGRLWGFQGHQGVPERLKGVSGGPRGFQGDPGGLRGLTHP